MRKVLIAFFLSLFLVGFSYFINNKNQCCDQIFQAGWPLPFYGGSGGFMGLQKDSLIIKGLILDTIFWFLISSALLYASIAYKKLFK